MQPTNNSGYTLVELLVVMSIFAVVTTLISVSFNRIVSNSGQLLKSTETEIGGLIGLELLRIDLGFAGFGLPSQLGEGFTYTEAKSHLVDNRSETDAQGFNDAPSSPPRPVIVKNNKGYNDSDYLVLKGSALGLTKTARAWSYLNYGGTGTPASSGLVAGDRVVVVNSVVRGAVQVRDLVRNGSSFVVNYDSQEKLPGEFTPQNPEDRYLVYGLAPKAKDSDDKITFPFNRADYYVGPPSDPNSFSKICAPGTGLLYRGMVTQKGDFSSFPLLDCVADMQVVFLLDSKGTGDIDTTLDDLGTLSADAIRDQLKEVRVYILAQQGKKDPSYSFPDKEILVGEERYSSLGHTWKQDDLLAKFGADWIHYRWKLYTIVVQPKNLD
jgi:prepilin-type N-terminal cleavage/methylation domain-containing protein